MQTKFDPKIVKDKVKIKLEKCFAETLELPNSGIIPLWDLFHVRNRDLFDLFQTKVSHKGYELTECKSMKVKSRLE